MTPNPIIPPEITTQVATVRARASVLVKSQMARIQATAQIMMQMVSTVKEARRTKWGLMKPRLGLVRVGCEGRMGGGIVGGIKKYLTYRPGYHHTFRVLPSHLLQ